ncbi:cory-CC-star protein [Alloalcanivorax xenomutans]|uniref:cory-CC-star protein n=1 Tax=Alloalcanivorax xenomutans TaxID=1094342 RepID=UPI0035A95663
MTLLGNLKRWYRRAGELGAEYYNAPYRSAIARARRDEDDLFMLMVFSETMGIPNPASWYTLELQPLLMERFHDWHRRMGMPHSPLDNFRCC